MALRTGAALLLCVLAAGSTAAAQQDCPKAMRHLAAAKESKSAADRERELREAVSACPALDDAHYALGAALLELDRPDEAVKSFLAANKIEPKTRNQLALGEAHMRANRLEEAEKSYREVLEKSPDNAAARQGLSVVYYRRERFEEAEKILREAIQHSPKNAQLYFNLGMALEQQGRKDEALTAYQTAAELEPTDTQLLITAGRLAAEAGNWRLAEKMQRLARLHAPGDPAVWLAVAHYHDLKSEFAEAQEALDQAAKLGGDALSIEINRGILLYKMGDSAPALSKLKKAVESHPNSSAARGALGWAYLSEGRQALAEQELKQALDLDKRNSFAASHLQILQNSFGKGAASDDAAGN